MEGFWEYLFLVWIIGVILIAAENVKITTILTTFLTGYALGVASILGAIYWFLSFLVSQQVMMGSISDRRKSCTRNGPRTSAKCWGHLDHSG